MSFNQQLAVGDLPASLHISSLPGAPTAGSFTQAGSHGGHQAAQLMPVEYTGAGTACMRPVGAGAHASALSGLMGSTGQQQHMSQSNLEVLMAQARASVGIPTSAGAFTALANSLATIPAPKAQTIEVREEDSDSDHPRPAGKRPQMQGRFSGRLALKEDEKRLVEECRLLAPLLGGQGKRSDKSRLTLAKIVRGIASGAVRKHCQEREDALNLARGRIMELEAALLSAERVQEQMQLLRAELEAKDKRLAELDPDPARTAGMVRMTQQQQLLRRSSLVAPDAASLSAAAAAGLLREPAPLATRLSVPGAAAGQLPAAAALNLQGNMAGMSGPGALGPQDMGMSITIPDPLQGQYGGPGMSPVPGGGMSVGGSIMSEQVRMSVSGVPPLPPGASAFSMGAGMGSRVPSNPNLRASGGGNGMMGPASGANSMNTSGMPPGATSHGGSFVSVGGGGPPLQSPFCISVTGQGSNGGGAGGISAILAQHAMASQQPIPNGVNGPHGGLVRSNSGAQPAPQGLPPAGLESRLSTRSPEVRTGSESGAAPPLNIPTFGSIKPIALSGSMAGESAASMPAAWQAALASLHDPAQQQQGDQDSANAQASMHSQASGELRHAGSKRDAEMDGSDNNKRTRTAGSGELDAPVGTPNEGRPLSHRPSASMPPPQGTPQMNGQDGRMLMPQSEGGDWAGMAAQHMARGASEDVRRQLSTMLHVQGSMHPGGSLQQRMSAPPPQHHMTSVDVPAPDTMHGMMFGQELMAQHAAAHHHAAAQAHAHQQHAAAQAHAQAVQDQAARMAMHGAPDASASPALIPSGGPGASYLPTLTTGVGNATVTTQSAPPAMGLDHAGSAGLLVPGRAASPFSAQLTVASAFDTDGLPGGTSSNGGGMVQHTTHELLGMPAPTSDAGMQGGNGLAFNASHGLYSL